jgi:hypothetical protein
MSIKKRNSVTPKKKYNMRGGFPSFKKSTTPKPVQPSYNTVSVIPGTTPQVTAPQVTAPVVPVAPLQPSTLPYNTVSTAPAVETPLQTSENNTNNNDKKTGIFAFIINLATILYTTIKSGYDSVVSIIEKTNELLISIDLSKIMDTDLRIFLRNKLVELNKISDDPVVQQNLNELAVKLGMYGNVAIGVAFSNVESLENEMINIVIRGADKITSSLVNIALNAASAIPLVGTAIGAARAFDNAAKMIETIVLTNLEIIEKVSNFNENFINSFTEKIKSMDDLNSGKNMLMNSFNQQKDKFNQQKDNVINKFNQQKDNLTNKLQTYNIIKKKGGAVSAIKKANEIKNRVNKSIARFHRTSKVKTKRRHS